MHVENYISLSLWVLQDPPACRQCPTGPPKVIVCGGRVKRGNGGENSWSSSSRVCSWSTAGQEFPLAFGVPFPPSLCSFLQAVDKFPPYKSVTWAGTNGLKGKEPGLEGRRMTVRAPWGEPSDRWISNEIPVPGNLLDTRSSMRVIFDSGNTWALG